jgi:hypothetical protein
MFLLSIWVNGGVRGYLSLKTQKEREKRKKEKLELEKIIYVLQSCRQCVSPGIFQRFSRPFCAFSVT